MIKVILGFALFFMMSSVAQADCRTANVAGAWKLFGASTTYSGYARGTVRFSRTGRVLANGSSMQLQGGVSVSITGGSVKLTKACALTGVLNTNAGVKIDIIDAQMDIPKANVSGVWHRSDGDAGLFMLTKK